MVKIPKSFLEQDAHSRLLLSLIFSVLLFAFLPQTLLLISRMLKSWVSYNFIFLFLSWFMFFRVHPKELSVISQKQDSSRIIIFLLIIAGSAASLLAVFILLGSIKNISIAELAKHFILAAFSVICSWFLVHTTFAMRYAHLYYGAENSKESPKGLRFPEEEEPDYLDFAYFSFIIGMTFQVSDVAVTSRKIRRLCLLHGMFSFGFNTTIIALTINILSSIF